ncbi:hypothetical protein HK100_008300, partial [Physocladia obscura]
MTSLNSDAMTNTNSYTALVVGATGAVGSRVVAQLLASARCKRVIALTRRELDVPALRATFKADALAKQSDTTFDTLAAEKLNVRVVDFEALAGNTANNDNASNTNNNTTVGPADAVFCCLGTTRADAGSAAAFRHIDHDYAVASAISAKAANPNTYFGLLTSAGADKNSWFLYLKTKGETEEACRNLAFSRFTIFRPGFLQRGNSARPIERVSALFLSTFFHFLYFEKMSGGKVNAQHFPETTPTPLEEIPKIVAGLHATFATNKTRDLAWRRHQLRQLYNFLNDQHDLISEALYKDLNKDPGTVLHDIMIVSSEAAHFLEYLDEYARPIHAKKTLMTLFDKNRILLDPLGVVCIIGTWNYPIQLLLGPLACAIAAGNCALLKPSEVATHTEALLLEWVPRIFDKDAIRIVSGSIPQATAILAQKFDHIFYTGNESVGKVILAAAAKHLTPVTLELGGKCPVYVDNHITNIDNVATRIVFGKLANTGQTCIAPDYILVHEKIAAKLVPALKKALMKLYTDNPRAVAHYGRIINKNHTERLVNVLQRQLALKHSRVVAGGEFDVNERYIAPLIVADVKRDDPLMEAEIFGPLLGIVEVSSVDDAIAIINSKSHPLMLYIHSDNAKIVQKVIGATRSGSVSVNDYFVNMALSDLPFGGVGASGMGAYHGRAGFL